jgi:hypothetical protein
MSDLLRVHEPGGGPRRKKVVHTLCAQLSPRYPQKNGVCPHHRNELPTGYPQSVVLTFLTLPLLEA